MWIHNVGEQRKLNFNFALFTAVKKGGILFRLPYSSIRIKQEENSSHLINLGFVFMDDETREKKRLKAF
jgi:hypothetical protein